MGSAGRSGIRRRTNSRYDAATRPSRAAEHFCQANAPCSFIFFRIMSLRSRDRKVEKVLRQADAHPLEMTITIDFVVSGSAFPKLRK